MRRRRLPCRGAYGSSSSLADAAGDSGGTAALPPALAAFVHSGRFRAAPAGAACKAEGGMALRTGCSKRGAALARPSESPLAARHSCSIGSEDVPRLVLPGDLIAYKGTDIIIIIYL